MSKTRLRWLALTLAAVIVAAGVLIWVNSGSDGPTIATENRLVSSGDAQLDTTLYLPEQTPAPAVLVAHGFGGSKESVDADARELAQRGFVALAWTARGFGRSTGQIALNAPDAEVADVSRLIDELAKRPEVQKDGDDPKVGITGGSYGGAISLLAAGYDKRIDALAPVITYNDLGQALIPNSATTSGQLAGTPSANAFAAQGVFKRSWAGVFFAAGMGGAGFANPSVDASEPGSDDNSNQLAAQDPAAAAAGGAQGAPPPGGRGAAQPNGPCGRFTPRVCAAYTELATTGKASKATVDLLRSVSPVSVTGRITQPTMIVQGEQDTLFGLDQSDATARQIAAAGGKVKMVWYAGGHDGGKPGPSLRAKIADWFDFHLRGRGADPGTSFEYAVQGAIRAQGAPSVRTMTAAGYPGLGGRSATERRPITLAGPQQTIVNPPGGNPGSITSMPGLGSVVAGSARLASRLAVDIPGQVARWRSEPLTSQLLVSGSSTVRIRVEAAPGAPVPADGVVLFAKLYDVAGDGTRTLPASAVSPLRVTQLPADVTVTLPGIVRPIEADHRIEVAVTTTDQAYAVPAQPAAVTVSLTDTALQVPVVPGTRSTQTPPMFALIGIGVVIGLVIVVAIVAAIRRRRADDVDPDLTGVPLVIDNLAKEYPGGLKAVDGLSFRVEKGQVLGLLGPNGAGKTTSLRMLMGLIQPTEGSIRVFGHKVHAGAPVLSRIGSFVEGSGFLPHLSGEANLRLYWAATGRPLEHAHFDEAIEIAGLGHAVRRRVKTYSQGMRQRLAIAQAMLGFPDMLVLDEPTNGLDPPQIHQMREVLKRYAATGRTVLVSSHLLAEVEQACTHVVVMHRGKLVAAGEVADIAAVGGEATFRVDQPDQAASVLGELAGVTGVEVDGKQVHANLDGTPRSKALGALVAAGVAVEQAGPRRRLEDAFLELVGENKA
ncbi:alpha/beta fold hydrolase [Kibdelosporangium phytohabitans]|uniref:ABC transporter ATP-binding protein n=1 Tax=Kibdelosporangium phytohabitans TaxID=860235 RepID=A0A0N9IB99_9PSEU|nr:alpha/beta fold hydrolase [Kibdelosporangium phytohabitans]ALG12419.1 ABC transporter ATP-binding protein [Kibdelosporangium phytohabitans]MBE1464004.1 ABC-2 type transport system ATP-binding protein [Kibdelosporangium phytohabitans]